MACGAEVRRGGLVVVAGSSNLARHWSKRQRVLAAPGQPGFGRSRHCALPRQSGDLRLLHRAFALGGAPRVGRGGHSDVSPHCQSAGCRSLTRGNDPFGHPAATDSRLACRKRGLWACDGCHAWMCFAFALADLTLPTRCASPTSSGGSRYATSLHRDWGRCPDHEPTNTEDKPMPRVTLLASITAIILSAAARAARSSRVSPAKVDTSPVGDFDAFHC